MLARAALSQLRRQVLPQQRGIASSAVRFGGGSKGPGERIPRNEYVFFSPFRVVMNWFQ